MGGGGRRQAQPHPPPPLRKCAFLGVPYCSHEEWCRAPESITNSQVVVVVGGRHSNGNKATPARLVAGSKSSGQPSPASS